MSLKQRRILFEQWLDYHLRQNFIDDNVDQTIASILHRLRAVDLNLSIRLKLCGNRDKDHDARGLRVKDDTIRLQFERRGDIPQGGHTIACDVLYRQALTALRKCRLSPKRFVWTPVSHPPSPPPREIAGSMSMPHPPQWRLIAPQQHCLLLQRLPTELRILIYTFALVPDAEEDVKATTLARLKADLGSVARLDIAEHIARMQPLPQKRFAPPALTAVCGQIREEVLRVLPLLEKWRVARMRMQEGEAVDEWLNRPAHHAFKVRRDELVSRIQQGS